jgi:hypothetical protein
LSKINYDNVEKNLCVICDIALQTVSFVVCQKCNNISRFDYKIIGPNVLDIKSTCCNADVNVQQKITCSDLCHIKLVDYMIEDTGKYQKVIDTETGTAHRVPTRLIIEEGITQQHLKEFPKWTE